MSVTDKTFRMRVLCIEEQMFEKQSKLFLKRKMIGYRLILQNIFLINPLSSNSEVYVYIKVNGIPWERVMFIRLRIHLEGNLHFNLNHIHDKFCLALNG